MTFLFQVCTKALHYQVTYQFIPRAFIFTGKQHKGVLRALETLPFLNLKLVLILNLVLIVQSKGCYNLVKE